jgi:hypothetical protein
MTMDEVVPDNYSADTKFHRKQVEQKLARWKLSIPPNVEIAFFLGDRAEGARRMQYLMGAHTKADTYYYKMWGEGEIEEKKQKGPPMPDSVKELLKRRKLPEPKNLEPLMKTTIKSIQACDDIHAIRAMYFDVYGAEAGANLTKERMKESMIYAIRELIEAKRRPADSEEAQPEPLDTVGTPQTLQQVAANVTLGGGVGPATQPKPAAPKAKASKTPIYEDKAAQAEKEAKYPWVIPGTWRQDPEHAGGTILDIKCQYCQMPRTIHAADAFQVKSHVECKKKSKAA